jgi:hypothetical protein
MVFKACAVTSFDIQVLINVNLMQIDFATCFGLDHLKVNSFDVKFTVGFPVICSLHKILKSLLSLNRHSYIYSTRVFSNFFHNFCETRLASKLFNSCFVTTLALAHALHARH